MVKKWQKQLEKFSHIGGLTDIIKDLVLNNLSEYDVIKLSGYRDLYRIRKGKIRIIFRKNSTEVEIVKIDCRGDVYKGI
ncbi:MAG: type II toxin-antitoxin system RelE/ParE family toxin [Candidatus Gracilibacteria bacterium]|nr:type II toxin-antitoxin system RelE/ParE family toxin [Candidatus Gracilibacteria bacterium]